MLISAIEQNDSVINQSVSQFSHSVVSDSLQPHGLQHARLPCHHQLLEFTKLMSTESVMPSSRLIFCHPLLLLPSVFPSIRFFSNESDLCIRWPKYWTFREWIHVYIWLSHFPLHLKLSHFLLISYTSIQNKKFLKG